MNAGPARPRAAPIFALILAALALLSAFALDWDLTALFDGAAYDRAWSFVASFGSPDLTGDTVARGLRLTAETLAIALLGVALGLCIAYPIALCAARCVVLGEDRHSRGGRLARRAVLEGSRLLLDVLRGVPDFAWALVIANFTGVGPLTGVIAIGVSVGGILGKILSEQWDNVDPVRYDALRSSGACGLRLFLFGIQPLSARAMLSYILMRTECAVRNASVIGVVGGGGIGAALWDEFKDAHYPGVATLLLFLLALTATTDLCANLLRYQLRVDPNHPRVTPTTSAGAATARRLVGIGAVALLLLGSLALLGERLGNGIAELGRIEWTFVLDYTTALFTPELSADALLAAAHESRVPLGVAVLSTLAAVGAATALAYFASVAFQLHGNRFTGERVDPIARVARLVQLVGSRLLGLVLRGIPEVAWVLVFEAFFGTGVTAGVLAVAAHSTGVLLRVFAETVDNVPYRTLEQVGGACRREIFVYGAVPSAWPDWKTYAFFQFEVNVRLGVVLGMVGAGGLGDAFHGNLQFFRLHRASTFLWTMVLLTVVIDRLSRRLLLRRLKC